MPLSQKLKFLRAENGLTQKQLAQKMNVARSTITGYETKNRQPSHEKLADLADIFGVSVDYLIHDEVTKRTSSFSLTVHQEHAIDNRVSAIYEHLSPKSKEAALQYMEFLEYQDRKRKGLTHK